MSYKMRFIGDVHAKFPTYQYITEEAERSIQVGDFGVGFREVPEMAPQHRFIRGNHDDPGRVAQYNWIPDGQVEDGMFFLGGGESIDRHSRIEGRDWWPEEQLSMTELYGIMDLYEAARPDILVCHECPSGIAPLLFSHNRSRIEDPSRTSQALDSLLYIHRPKMVIFGHWHINKDEVIQGTRFICLAELSWIDLDIG